MNRDGTGAVIMFMPKGGQPIMIPETTGQMHGAHDNTHILGMGKSNEGTLVVLWPGSTYNTLKVCAYNDLRLLMLTIELIVTFKVIIIPISRCTSPTSVLLENQGRLITSILMRNSGLKEASQFLF